MTQRTHGVKRRLSVLLSAGMLLAGGAGAAMLATGGIAEASGCSSTTSGSCTMDGDADLSAGSLALAGPTGLAWTSTLSGYNLKLVDSTDDSLTIIDPTGSGDGWNVTASATTFTHSSNSLANTGTLVVNGSTSSETYSTLPTNACDTNSTCTAPATSATGGAGSTNSVVTYPVDMTTAPSSPTSYVIYNADASSGEGANVVSPLGWWLNVPADSPADSAYASTITLTISDGPATIS